jgi:bifunctional ADP-heptose synthase (sugar kinase/adenylyltransferase)
MLIANVAAGLAVGEVGAVARVERLRNALTALRWQGARPLRTGHARRGLGVAGKRIVFTNGASTCCMRSLVLLQEAARQGDVLVLAINSDESVRRLKGLTADRAPANVQKCCGTFVRGCSHNLPRTRPWRRCACASARTGEGPGLHRDGCRPEIVEANGARCAGALVAEKSTTALVNRIRRSQSVD